MTTNNYDAASALTVYYTDRTTKQLARHWSREKVLHDWADLGAAEFFEGSGDNPTTISGYALNKLWLRVEAGVTTTVGTVRRFAGGDATLLANWPVLDRPGFSAHIGAHGGNFDYAWSTSTSGDPGTGKVLANNATLASATSINVSKTGRQGQSYSARIATWDDSTTLTNRGRLVFYSVTSAGALFDVRVNGAVTDNGTYYTVPIVVLSSGSVANGDLVGIAFHPTGDKGQDGAASIDVLIVESYADATSSIAPTGVNAIETLGYSSIGDGGGAVYKYVGSEPSHVGKFQTSDGKWWELKTSAANPKMFGAAIDGSTDDTTAANNCASYCTATGADFIFADGAMRVTATIKFGASAYNAYAFLVNRTDAVGDAVYTSNANATNQTSNLALHPVNVRATAGAIVVADFAPGTPTPVIEYNLRQERRTGVIEDITVARPEWVTSGRVIQENSSTTASNNLIGLVVTTRGAGVIRNISGYGLGKGALLVAAGYWTHIDRVMTWACGDGVHLPNFNAGHAENITCWYGNRGVVMDGDSSRVQCNTQQVPTSLRVFLAISCTFEPGYFEDTSISDGTGLYQLDLGQAASGGGDVINCVFMGIRNGSRRTNGGAVRMVSVRNSTFIGCRAFSGPITADSLSRATLIDTDYTATASGGSFPIDRFSTLGGGSGAIARNYASTAAIVHHEDAIQINFFDYGTIAAGSTVVKNLTIPAVPTYNQYSIVITQQGGGSSLVTFDARLTSATNLRLTIGNPTASGIAFAATLTAHLTLNYTVTSVTPT